MSVMLYRNLGSSQLEGWDAEATARFFTRTAAMEDSRYKWETVRSTLIEQETTRLTQEESRQVVAESLPKSVWKARGYDEEMIERFPAEKDSKFGQLYSIPVKADVWKDVKSKVTEQILHKERAVLEKSKRKQPDTDSTENNKEPAWDVAKVAKTVATPAAKGKAKAGSKAGEAKQQEKQAKQVLKDNEKKNALAARAVAALTALDKSLLGLIQPATKNGLDPSKISSLQEARAQTESWMKAAIECLAWTEYPPVLEKEPLPDLPFDAEALNSHLKASKQVMAELRKEIRAGKGTAA